MADENHKWLTFWSSIFYCVIITQVMNSARPNGPWVMITQ
jgi:hypothetical protein